MEALSVAAAVVQFVDFGTRLLQGTVARYRSPTGHAEEHADLSVAADDLSRLVDDMNDRLGSNSGPAAEILRRLGQECGETREILHEIVSVMQAHGSNKLTLAASSFWVALKANAAPGKIRQLEGKLEKCRQLAHLATLQLLVWVIDSKAVDSNSGLT